MQVAKINSKKTLAVLVVLALAGAGGFWTFSRSTAAPRPSGGAPIPVVVTRVEMKDVPHLTSGIGTVQSLHSVNIRSQVDGTLTEVLFQEGQFVNKGDLLAKIDDRTIMATIEQARAEKARNEAQLTAAQHDLTRYNNLLKEEAISKQVIDQQTAQVAQLKATVRANEATIAVAQVQLSHTRITSPVSGRVGIRRIDVGNVVRASDAEGLVTVTQINPISVVFSLPQELLPRIQQVMSNESGAPVTALDRDAGIALGQGKLAMVDNQVDSTTGTIRLKAQFQNKDGKLWPGQFVAVQLRTGLSPQALVVSAGAVQRGLDKLFVYRVKDDKVEAVPVTVKHENSEVAVIGSGLALGDVVVRDGQSRLKPGSKVTVVANGPKPK